MNKNNIETEKIKDKIEKFFLGFEIGVSDYAPDLFAFTLTDGCFSLRTLVAKDLAPEHIVAEVGAVFAYKREALIKQRLKRCWGSKVTVSKCRCFNISGVGAYIDYNDIFSRTRGLKRNPDSSPHFWDRVNMGIMGATVEDPFLGQVELLGEDFYLVASYDMHSRDPIKLAQSLARDFSCARQNRMLAALRKRLGKKVFSNGTYTQTEDGVFISYPYADSMVGKSC